MVRGFAGVAALALLSACGGPEWPEADKTWVRLAAVPSRPAAAYFTLDGGKTDQTLINVSADLAIRAEMHASMTGAHDMATMKPLASVPVPARAVTAFQPGGRHVMLYDVAPGVKRGDTMMLTFSFADGHRLKRRAIVIGAADPAPDW